MIPSVNELVAEMRRFSDQVVGVTDLAVVTTDGLLIAADTDEDVNLDRLAAIAAATLGLATGSGKAVSMGSVRQATVEFGGGYLVVRPVGEYALMAVLGDLGMDLTGLNLHAQAATERIDRLLTAPEEAEPSAAPHPPRTCP